MTRYRRRERTIAACLTALAGYVDALGFLKLGGFFVSFMSGNSTRLGVGLEQGLSQAVLPFSLVGLFIAGVMDGSFVGHAAENNLRVVVLVLVAILLTLVAALELIGFTYGVIAAMVLAMGAENTIFEHDGEVSIGLTYMTGTPVKLGQRISVACLGGDRLAWSWYLLLWLGLVAGTVISAGVYARIGLGGLWFAATAAALLAVAMGYVTDDARESAVAQSNAPQETG